jgi:site-specific recombinase XerD
MKLLSRGGMWQVHFTDAAGERKRMSTKVRVNPNLADKGKAQANLAALDIMRTALLDELPAEARRAAGKVRTLAYALNETFEHRWRHQKSSKERQYVAQRIIREVGYWPLASITYTRLQDYGAELEGQGDSPATRNRKMSCIQTALADAMRRGEIDRLPQFPHWAENNIKERYLTRDEEGRLFATMAGSTAPDDEPGQYLRHMIELLLDTGLRASEALLDAEQDLGDKIWLKHGTTKSGRGRSIPLTARAREALDYILKSPTHKRLKEMHARNPNLATQFLGRRFATMTKRADVAGVTLHTLRHTCASRLVQAGVDLYKVKKWLGHSSVVVTERYAHLAPDSLSSAVAALEDAAMASAGAVPVESVTPASTVATVH